MRPERISRGFLSVAAAAFLLIGIPAFLAPVLTFSFSRPGHAIYLLAYVIVGLVIAAALIYIRRRPEAASAQPR